ncbi:putative porin [Vibrio sp. F74]|uniref:putative porin n=1 Tax=Vibrio sp. F74 TaxID=700020 RepID=UPI0035F55C02
MNRMIIPLCTALVSSASLAGGYNTEIDATYTTRNFDSQDINSSLLSATYYFQLIDDSKGPLAESSFLGMSSELSLKYGLVSQEYLDNATTWGIAGKYVSESGFIIGIDYVSKHYEPTYGHNAIIDSGFLRIGGYIDDTSTLIAGISTNQNDDVTSNNDYRSTTFALDYKKVFMLENSKALNLYGRFGYTEYQEDNNDSIGSLQIGTDYYFNRKLSVGLDLATFGVNPGTGANNEYAYRYGLQSTYFITQKFSVYGSYRITDFEDVSENENMFLIGFQTRF